MTDAPLPLALFDYELPPNLIAQAPVEPRDTSRLLVLPRAAGSVRHLRFLDLPEQLNGNDLLVVNRTRVIPARLHARRSTGGKAELLLHRPLDGPLTQARRWRGLGKPGAALKPGAKLELEDGTTLEVEARDGPEVIVRADQPIYTLMERVGHIPLPPYVRRDATAKDTHDYQTMFAAELGAVAAPTASLHFTERALAALEARGVRRADVVLHVGPGTFLPVREDHAEDVRQHVMHAEWYEVSESTQNAIAETKRRGGRVIAVGTTTVRALESWQTYGTSRGEATLFIYPGFRFSIVDALLTNFHLPRSTLLMLVSAFAGRDRVVAAYAEAVREGYRFFSYGDAMFIV